MRRRASPHRRPERVAEVVRQIVSGFLTGEARDPRIGFVTVTGVEVSKDLSHARVRVSVMGTAAQQEETMAGLASAAGYLRAQIAKGLATRVTPDVTFVLDRGIEHAARIDAVLRELKREEEGD